jgi:hypothetical protein
MDKVANDHEYTALPEASLALGAVIREFLIDFLGSLVPGLLFTITAALPVWWSATLVWRALQSATYTSAATGIAPLKVVEQFRIETLCLLFVLSYVLGGVFYRRDPKFPDQKSATYVLWREVKNKLGKERWSVIQRCVIQPVQESPSYCEGQDVLLASEKSVSDLVEGEGGQFPYSHLYEYLRTRGLGHLAGLVPWKGNDFGSHGHRTKMFINLLKVRLHYAVPHKCGDIVRNEAHIRMMSSVWYAASALQQLCCVATVTAIPSAIVIVLTHGWRPFEAAGNLGAFLLFLGILFTGATTLRLTIRNFFHYQRVREIVYVLETAYFAAKEGHSNILENLS